MTKSWMKLGLFITLLALLLALESESKKPKVKGCINKGKVYKNNQILNVDECNFKICKKNNKRRNTFRWSKLKLKKKECCNYKKTVLSNGMEKEVDGVMVICENGKIEIVSYGWHDFNRNLEESCHESHSVAKIGFPLLAQMKELQDYAEDIESEKNRILKENSTWVCGKNKLHTLIKNERLIKTFSWLPWVQWFKNVFSPQTRSSGLPWKSVINKYEDKFQKVNRTITQDSRIIGGNNVSLARGSEKDGTMWRRPPPIYRDDFRCGSYFPNYYGDKGKCDPKGIVPCCSPYGWCGNTDAHCKCARCVDYASCKGFFSSDWNCCKPWRTCAKGEGHCKSNADCRGRYKCGHKNCRDYFRDAHPDANCCKDTCFAPGSVITMEDGSFKKIEELRLGDSVLTANENFKPEFSKFLGWLHKDETKPTVYLELQTKNASIKISPKHLILKKSLHGEEIFVMAKHISLGDNVFIKIPIQDSFRWEPVENILTQNKIGVYAPLTESGTIVVDNYVASCYAEISNHNHAHSVMAPVRLMPSILEDEESQWKSGVRTYPMNLFRMAKGLGLIKNDDKTEVMIKKTAWMNTRMMNKLNIELLVLLNYFVLKK